MRPRLNKVEDLLEKFINLRLKMLNPKQLYSVDAIKSLLFMPKDLKTESCISSNVKAFGYNERSKTLKVLFKSNAEYRYLGIKKELFKEISSSPSKGKALFKIKMTKPCIKITEESFKE